MRNTIVNFFEKIMQEALESGKQPTLELFGNISSLQEASSIIGVSLLMPEFLRLAFELMLNVNGDERDNLSEFICRSIEYASNDFVIMEVIDLLEHYGVLSSEEYERCFNRFLNLASDRKALPMARAASLDAAFRLSILNNRKLQLRLLVLLLDIKTDDDPIFLAHTAKIIGLAYTHWREDELLKKLCELVEIDDVEDEASFELGMAKLSNGLETEDRTKAEKDFKAAKYWFIRSFNHREQRPDAAAYICCLDIILAFSNGEVSNELNQLAETLSLSAFEIQAWHNQQGTPPWLGFRYTEYTYWTMLVTKLKGLSVYLEEVSWWEPSVVIEEYILACYTASRSILKRTRDGGIESIIRPRLERTLSRFEGQLYHLKTWLRLNSKKEWEAEANNLYQQIDNLIKCKEPSTSDPSEAMIVRPPIIALIKQAEIPKDAKKTALSAIISATNVHLSNLSQSEFILVDKCIETVREFSDYKSNPSGNGLFNAVLLWTICFLRNRLEMTKKDDPGITYLFEKKDGTLPLEHELQEDYYRFMQSYIAGTNIEATNIGAGRADVCFTYGGERLITEVKREIGDCSFNALERNYSAQTTDYQNVSIRMGFLLVLDLTVRTEGTPHILTLVKPCTIVRKAETEPRYVVIVKVPGRRFRPSDLTKTTK
jgi:hypothetical protein